ATQPLTTHAVRIVSGSVEGAINDPNRAGGEPSSLSGLVESGNVHFAEVEVFEVAFIVQPHEEGSALQIQRGHEPVGGAKASDQHQSPLFAVIDDRGGALLESLAGHRRGDPSAV